jgi:hypothetical protein
VKRLCQQILVGGGIVSNMHSLAERVRVGVSTVDTYLTPQFSHGHDVTLVSALLPFSFLSSTPFYHLFIPTHPQVLSLAPLSSHIAPLVDWLSNVTTTLERDGWRATLDYILTTLPAVLEPALNAARSVFEDDSGSCS